MTSCVSSNFRSGWYSLCKFLVSPRKMPAGWHSRKNWHSLLPRLSVHSWWIELTSHFCRGKIGRRKSWHLVGTVLGVIFMPMFFSTCYACPNDREEWQKIVRLSIFNVILALSGSLLDIGHLTLIPVIAKDQIEAVELSALRFVLRLPYNSIF